MFSKETIHIILFAILVIGGINWLSTAVGYNLVDILHTNINNLFNSTIPIDKLIYIIVGIAAIILASRRDNWLPFLGQTVLPDNLLNLHTPVNYDKIITINTTPNSKIVYWAALPKGKNPDVKTAYSDYSNSGVVMSDNSGIAKLPILQGSSYIVPSLASLNNIPTGRNIPRHVHWRVLGLDYGMMGPVETIYY
jgi:uncharacterized membrane protein YuzA (DUF378 family)